MAVLDPLPLVVALIHNFQQFYLCRTIGGMCQFDVLGGCPYTQSRMLTYTVERSEIWSQISQILLGKGPDLSLLLKYCEQ